MLTLEDHRLLAERCVRLAKSSKPNVAQYLMALAANYLELTEFAGKVRRPEDVVTHASREEKAHDGEPRLDATI